MRCKNGYQEWIYLPTQASPSILSPVLIPAALPQSVVHTTLACCMPGPRQATARVVWSRSAPQIVARGSTTSLSSGVGGGLQHSGRNEGHALRTGQGHGRLWEALWASYHAQLKGSPEHGCFAQTATISSAAHRLPR